MRLPSNCAYRVVVRKQHDMAEEHKGHRELKDLPLKAFTCSIDDAALSCLSCPFNPPGDAISAAPSERILAACPYSLGVVEAEVEVENLADSIRKRGEGKGKGQLQLMTGRHSRM
ncbi:hypothetical protein ACLKA6_004278 [Drosophila palustris]